MKTTHTLLLIFLASCSTNKETKSNDFNTFSSSTTNTTESTKDILFANSIYFKFDSYKLSPEAKKKINLLARYLKTSTHINTKVKLEGYCDELGTEDYNYNLGLARANAVRNYLVILGIDGDRVVVSSYGKDRQDVKGKSDDVIELNRKVIISFCN